VSVLPILIQGEPVLRRRAAPVAEITEDIRRLARDMTETMYAAPGRGLAAPQVGVAQRLFVIDAFWKDGADRAPRVMIDPEILGTSDETAAREEGCLSIPGVPVRVERPAAVHLGWTDPEGVRHEEWLSGIEAVCAQHEFDHLEGRLISDRLTGAARAALGDPLSRLAGGSWTPGK
jgi:peptide deformylase